MKYIIACLFIGLSLSLNAQQIRDTSDTKNTANTTDAKDIREVPKLNEKEKLEVISKMKDYKEVQEALIVQQDEIKKISLALIVKQGTSKEKARELGDHFLRHALNHFVAENKAGKRAGISLYNYMISVCTDRDVILMGTKLPDEKNVTW
mgnify:CR=1 FL=1